ncbi:hypothetical protein, partial [Microcoleus sp.]|uniref:hypothetical protein n=1 Tax=Microcoleus sp. TaxID=44472 RepID=UPI003525E23C
GGKGDFEKIPVPPLGRGARGDLALIVKQQSLTEFELKLTPMGTTHWCQLKTESLDKSRF